MLGPMRHPGLAFAAVLLAVAPAVSADAPPAPKAVFETTSFDGGSIRPGADVEASFTVRNDGTGELRILSVKPG